ncbi:uncharacterized protein isoform X2 [Choristoneura fumiferana]|uniref:uncharacterized protein isoform X2 n=1 Tax=Choristoneura fumiferana TaxID=7141 RepID=UPI003D154D79
MICLLPGCESRTGNKGKGQNITSFHRFPSLSSPVRQKWVEFVNRSQVGNWTLRKCHRLCSKHFSLDSFIVSNNNRVYLKDTAVPTIMFSSHIKKIVRTHSRNVRAVPLLRCVDKSNLLAHATPTTASTHSPGEETVPSSNHVNYVKLLPHPTQTPASRCNPDGVVVPSTHPVNNPKLLLCATPTTASRCNPDGGVVPVPSSHPVNNPKLLPHATPTTASTCSPGRETISASHHLPHPTPTTASRCNPDGAIVQSSHRVKNPNLFRGSILITRSAVPLLRRVNNLNLLPPASRTSAPIPIRRRYNATPASNNNNDELHKKIEKLQKELARIQKLAKKRFLKINALKKRVYRLQKSNLEQGNALVELLEKEE